MGHGSKRAPARGDESATTDPSYVLSLYVAGASTRSSKAIETIRRICERYLKGHYSLEVVDLYQQPEKAAPAQIVAAPTLLREEPGPIMRLVGDLSDEAKVLAGLGVPPAA